MIRILLLMLVAGSLKAQPYTFQTSSNPKIRMEFSNADLIIKGHSGSTITILRTSDPEIKDERASGLTMVSNYPDNSGTGFYLGEEEGVVHVLRQDFGKASYTIEVPQHCELSLTQYMWNSNKITLENLENGVTVKSTNADVDLAHVGGASNVEVVSGNITVRDADLPMKLKSVSGKVVVHIPDKTPANLDLRTISGRIDCDFPIVKTIRVKGSTLTQIGPIRQVESAINGGGQPLMIESVSGKVHVLAVN